MTLTKAHTIINNLILREGLLPRVDYRVSADYGRLEVALTKTSVGDDFFGPTMNMCVKINSRAPLNGLVVRGDLYETMRKHFPLHSAYHFEEMKGEEGEEGEERHEQEESSQVLESHRNNRLINVMIIDYKPDALLSLKAFLENKPYSVEVFSNAKEALQKFALLGPSHYNLVISDIRMPDMNGLQL
ncbi:MAG: response regulator [Thermoproteota archaeon]|nr:response regulator [Thermoproteota archaeon]